MKILAAHFYHESNTFAKRMTSREDFSYYPGGEMLLKLAGIDVLQEAKAEIIPVFHASRWSSGMVTEEAFRSFEREILESASQNADGLSGIWLSLHGGMTVENIGSGEYALLRDLRLLVGEDLPIAVSFDLHANNRPGIEALANVITGYQTAPHTDADETQRKAARALLSLIRSGKTVHPALVRAPMLLCGERAITSMEPLRSLMLRCKELEKNERFLAASLFVGMAWGDTPDTAVTSIVTPAHPCFAKDAKEEAEKLSNGLFMRRGECAYAHPSYEPEEAVRQALSSPRRPLFLSDSGDNPTAGGEGNSTLLLRLMLQADRKGKRVLFAPIFDADAVRALSGKIGERVTASVGMGEDEVSKPVLMDGTVLRKGEIFSLHGQAYEKAADYLFLRLDGIDLILTDAKVSFTGMECFETAEVAPADYDVVVLKMGYLFAELAPHCKEVLMALTPGRTPLRATADQYRHLKRPIWPLDSFERTESPTSLPVAYGPVPPPVFELPSPPEDLPQSVYDERLRRVLSGMKRQNLQSLFVYADREHGANFGYLTGFEPRFEEAGLILHEDGQAFLLLGNETLKMHAYSRLPAKPLHAPIFSLPNQPMVFEKPFSVLLREASIETGSRVGLAGWKLFTGHNALRTDVFDLPCFLVEAFRDQNVTPVNATGIFINPAHGARITVSADEAATYEYAAATASYCVEEALKSLAPGKTELELASLLNRFGMPLSCYSMCATGERFSNAVVFPRNKKVSLGDKFTASMGLRGGLSCRAGYVVNREEELPHEVRSYLDALAMPYFGATAAWYEAVRIGATGGEIFDAVERVFPRERFGWTLNPGHLTADEEWMSSPMEADSFIPLRSGMMLQMDLIPRVPGMGGINAEDGVLLADETLREELKTRYPKVYARMLRRREYIRSALGIRLSDEVLPMTDSVGYLRPFLLNRDNALFIAR